MATFLKIVLPCIALLGAITGCQPLVPDTQSPSNKKTTTPTTSAPAAPTPVSTKVPSRILLTPDEYTSSVARNHGYTIIHEDTNTSPNDERCGNGGGRYSSNGQSMCEIFNDKNDWYSANQAQNTNCPSGYTRVDQAGIGRANLAGSDRQCRTTTKVQTRNEVAHYYCPHGPNLVGVRTGAAASRYGVCQMKCDSDIRHLYPAECGTPSPGNNAATPKSPAPTTTTKPTFVVPFVPPSPPPTPTTQPVIPSPPTAPELPRLELQLYPEHSEPHIVDIATWFWLSPDQWASIEGSRSMNGRTFTTLSRPVDLKLIIDGPVKTQIKCQFEPEILQQDDEIEPTCTYRWLNAGKYTVKTEIQWESSWSCEPNCGSGDFPPETVTSDVISLEVSEAQALVIS